MPDVITCTSEGDDPSGRRRQGVNRPDDAPAGRRKGASLVPRARETRPLVVTGKPVCEPHDSTGEPGAGNRPAGFGERGEETYPRDSACGPVAKAPDKPPTPYRLRASPRLYPPPANNPAMGARCSLPRTLPGGRSVECLNRREWGSAGIPAGAFPALPAPRRLHSFCACGRLALLAIMHLVSDMVDA